MDCTDYLDGEMDEDDPYPTDGGRTTGNPTGGDSPWGSCNSSPGNYNRGNEIGYGKAPRQGINGSTYTQIASDGTGRTVSITTYGEYNRPYTRVDYVGRDHRIGLPHIHTYSWGYHNGGIYRTSERVEHYAVK